MDQWRMIPPLLECGRLSLVCFTDLLSFPTVRKSARVRKGTTKEESAEEREPAASDLLPPSATDAPPSRGRGRSALSGVGQPEIQRTETDAAAGGEPEPQHPENQTQEPCGEEGEEKKWDIKGTKVVKQGHASEGKK